MPAQGTGADYASGMKYQCKLQYLIGDRDTFRSRMGEIRSILPTGVHIMGLTATDGILSKIIGLQNPCFGTVS